MCSLLLAASPFALAQDKTKKKEPTEAQKKQQQRMADCNKQAGAKKLEGDARKKFMSSCLGVATPRPRARPRRRRSSSSGWRTATRKPATKNLEGDARKKFMSACLKG